MTEATVDYEEYLRRATAQRQRDADRFTGVDQHLDEPIYDPETGKRLNPVRPRLVIELDGEGLPVIVVSQYNTTKELNDLCEAATNHRMDVNFGRGSGMFDPRTMALRAIANEARRLEEADRHRRERPYVCSHHNNDSWRFKTERGLLIHQRSCRRRGRAS